MLVKVKKFANAKVKKKKKKEKKEKEEKTINNKKIFLRNSSKKNFNKGNSVIFNYAKIFPESGRTYDFLFDFKDKFIFMGNTKRYVRIDEECNTDGAFSVVFKCFDLKEKKIVAIKRQRFSSINLGSLSQELSIALCLSNENNKILQKGSEYIVKYIDYYNDIELGCYYLVFEYATGNLYDIVTSEKYYLAHNSHKYDFATQFLYQIGNALAYMHYLGIAHRDIKLENILVFELKTKGKYIFKICDFGLSCYYNKKQNTSVASVGSVHYASPEIFNSKIPHKNDLPDVWALGVCLFVILTCQHPFNVNEVDNEHEANISCTTKAITSISITHKFEYQLPTKFINLFADIFKFEYERINIEDLLHKYEHLHFNKWYIGKLYLNKDIIINGSEEESSTVKDILYKLDNQKTIASTSSSSSSSSASSIFAPKLNLPKLKLVNLKQRNSNRRKKRSYRNKRSPNTKEKSKTHRTYSKNKKPECFDLLENNNNNNNNNIAPVSVPRKKSIRLNI